MKKIYILKLVLVLVIITGCETIKKKSDEIVKKDNLKEFYETFKKQKNADVSMETISKSNHLFEGKLDPLMNTMTKYIEKNKS